MGCFQVLVIIKHAAVNIMENGSLLYVGEYFGYVIRSGIAGSSGNTMSNLGELPEWYPEWLYQFEILPTMEKSSLFHYIHVSICCHLSFLS